MTSVLTDASVLTAVLTVGAIARITRFGTADHMFIFEWWRNKMTKVPFFRDMFTVRNDGSVVGCDWCLSVWIAAAVVPLAYLWGDTAWFVIPAGILTASHVTGWLASREND